MHHTLIFILIVAIQWMGLIVVLNNLETDPNITGVNVRRFLQILFIVLVVGIFTTVLSYFNNYGVFR